MTLFSLNSGPPHSPLNLTIISKTSTTLLVKWSVAYSGGFPLKKFELIVDDTSMHVKHDITDCLTKSECQYRIKKLTPQEQYL